MTEPLSNSAPLTLMISSRCNDEIDYQGVKQPLSVLRKALKEKLENITIAGKKMFKVWIHEDESNSNASVDNWELCKTKARNADVFLMLYNGRAGWRGTSNPIKDGIGICHAELTAAFNRSPSKVRCIEFTPLVRARSKSPDKAFQDYVKKLNISGAQVANGEQALERVDELAAAVVLSLAREGVGINSSGNYFAGEALEWSRLNFQERRKVMVEAVVGLLRNVKPINLNQSSPEVAFTNIRESQIGFVCHAIPASFATAAARELVGQPFLRDHAITEKWDPQHCGPVHVIACQKGITESQAIRQLGFPDAVVVSHPFGVYVADKVQKIQIVFIAKCRDETTTKNGVQDFLRWLEAHGEAEYLVQRAKQRRQISDFVRTMG